MRPPCNSKTKTQRSEPKWLLKYLITRNFCAKFQPNRLTTTFGPWNTFSDNDTGMASEEFANFIPKDDRPANSRDANPLVTIWIIVDKTTYKDPAPKTLD